MKLSELGEFGFIARIAARTGQDKGLLLGIGDDAAVTRMTEGMVLLSTADMLAENIHFDLEWSDPDSLGRKSLAVNLSDIAAMGGIPRYALLSLAIPAALPLEFLDCFMAGFLGQAQQFGVTLIGGDTSASAGGLVINVTLLGEQYPDRVVRRSGATAGDTVCVSGTLGDSSLGLQLLRRGERGNAAVRRHLDPTPRVILGRSLAEAGIPTAMIDISDGLAADLGHVLAASGSGAVVDIDRLPLSASFRAAVAGGKASRYDLPLSGGEDYELLLTLSPDRFAAAKDLAAAAGTMLTAIGEITADQGLSFKTADGSGYEVRSGGYDHFTTA